IVDALTGGPSTNTLLLRGFQQLGQQIAALATHLDQRLNYLEDMERQALARLDDIYGLIIQGQRDQLTAFHSLAHQADAIQTDQDLTLPTHRFADLNTAVLGAQRALATQPPGQDSATFNPLLNTFLGHALNVSRTHAFAGTPIATGTTFFTDFATTVRQR